MTLTNSTVGIWNDSSLALATDLYQLTMAYGYWRHGLAERESVFHLYFRKHPFKGNYTIAAGLAYAIEVIQNFRFTETDREFLLSLKGVDGKELFPREFVEYLGCMELKVDVDGVEEGTIVFPREPLLRIQGPLLQVQLLETILLNVMNFQTLIATKASRICRVAAPDSVLEFGLRRAQGLDGGLSASRAAYVGGCHATSNVLAGKLFGIPVRGTHAHSWVMTFDTELEAFEKYAAAMPNNCVFLVDTYNTIGGIQHSIEIGRRLKEAGHRMVGIRLDSGNLADLSITARRMLDEAGLADAAVVASNDLDEYSIAELKRQGARINIWGVGTKLATAFDQPALGGVYKLAAIKDAAGNWQWKLKRSENLDKSSDPGILQVRRYYRNNRPIGDLLWNLADEPPRTSEFGNSDADRCEDILKPVFRGGKLVREPETTSQSRTRTIASLTQFAEPISDTNANYPVRLTEKLESIRQNLLYHAHDSV